MSDPIDLFFSKRALRLTMPRRRIFNSLKLAEQPLSHAQIAAANPEVDRVSVYRTIALFVELGIAIAVPHGWKQRYELASPFKPHHHHLFCTECGKIEDIQSDDIEGIVNTVAHLRGFTVLHHTFEISGLCGNCKKA